MRLGPWGRRPKGESLPRARRGAEEEVEERFDCESCGANLTFEPGSNHTTCAHCGHENSIPEEEDVFEEQDYYETLNRLERLAVHGDQRVVACQSCGAQFTLEPDSHAGACVYCGSDVVTDTGRNRPIKPEALGPFEIDQEAARLALRKWMRRLWFAPSGLAKFARHHDAFSGIYLPFWTFDAKTESRYRGSRGTQRFVPRRMPRIGKPGPDLRSVPRSEIRWRRVTGRILRRFDDVLALAGSNLPMSLVRGLAPWRLGDLVPYREEYLAGFRADAYQIDLPEGYEEAKREMQEIIMHLIREDIGGDLQRIHRVETAFEDVTFKQILLPVWLASYRYKGRFYQVVVNGQTGRVSGDRPYSSMKLVFLGLVIALAVTAGLYFFGR